MRPRSSSKDGTEKRLTCVALDVLPPCRHPPSFLSVVGP